MSKPTAKSKQIRNCVFGFQCEQTWSSMTHTEVDGIRFCSQCQEEVHFCETDEDIAHAVKMNWCIAIQDASRKHRAEPPIILVGEPLPPPGWGKA